MDRTNDIFQFWSTAERCARYVYGIRESRDCYWVVVVVVVSAPASAWHTTLIVKIKGSPVLWSPFFLSPDNCYDSCRQEVAFMIQIHTKLVYLLHLVVSQTHVRALVLTCGLHGVWENVPESEGLSAKVRAIGGGHLSDALVTTPTLKVTLNTRLRDLSNCHGWAFGESPLGLEMSMVVNQAIAVTGEEPMVSTSKDEVLKRSIRRHGFRPCQAVLPSHPIPRPRLDPTRSPSVHLTDHFFYDSMFIR
jgi:hypothetical protein